MYFDQCFSAIGCVLGTHGKSFPNNSCVTQIRSLRGSPQSSVFSESANMCHIQHTALRSALRVSFGSGWADGCGWAIAKEFNLLEHSMVSTAHQSWYVWRISYLCCAIGVVGSAGAKYKDQRQSRGDTTLFLQCTSSLAALMRVEL